PYAETSLSWSIIYCRQRYPCGHSFVITAAATTEFYTLSLHDALPISPGRQVDVVARSAHRHGERLAVHPDLQRLLGREQVGPVRSEEHTSELQSRGHLVCRLLLEKT